MIWGKTLDPGKLYTETVHADIHLSMAALESRSDRGAEYSGYTQVMLKTDEDEFLLCTLVHGLIFQQNLDVKVKQGEQISIYARGKNKVHLTGYSVIVEGAVVTPDPIESINNTSLQPVPVSIQTEDSHTGISYQEEVNNTPVIKVEYPMEEPINHWQPTMVHRLPRTFETNQAIATHHRVPVRLTTTKPRRDRKVTLNHGNRTETEASDAVMNHGLPHHLPSSTHYESDTNGNENATVTEGRENFNPSSEQEAFGASDEEDQSSPGSGHPPTMCKISLPSIAHGKQVIIAEGALQDGSEEITDTKEHNRSNVIQNVASQSQIPVSSGIGQLQAQLFHRVQFQDFEEGFSSLMPTPVRGYQCEFCLKFFKHVSNFKSHQLIHTNLKPFKCRFCGVGFKQTGNLKAHERIHTGDRPYKCSYCGKQFARSTTRNTHERLHTGSVTYQCGVCSKVFMQANSLKKHEMLHKT